MYFNKDCDADLNNKCRYLSKFKKFFVDIDQKSYDKGLDSRYLNRVELFVIT